MCSGKKLTGENKLTLNQEWFWSGKIKKKKKNKNRENEQEQSMVIEDEFVRTFKMYLKGHWKGSLQH